MSPSTLGLPPSCINKTPSITNSLLADSKAEAFSSFCAIGKQITLARIAPYIVVSNATAIAGLVIMLGNMSDPKAIGPAMAVALLTTMYGAILANVICLPIAQKLENASALESANNELVIEGVLFMQEGGNPRVLGDMLASFVSPKSREKIAAA